MRLFIISMAKRPTSSLDELIDTLSATKRDRGRQAQAALPKGTPYEVPASEDNKSRAKFNSCLAFLLLIEAYKTIEDLKKQKQPVTGEKKLDSSNKKDVKDPYRSTRVSRQADVP